MVWKAQKTKAMMTNLTRGMGSSALLTSLCSVDIEKDVKYDELIIVLIKAD